MDRDKILKDIQIFRLTIEAAERLLLLSLEYKTVRPEKLETCRRVFDELSPLLDEQEVFFDWLSGIMEDFAGDDEMIEQFRKIDDLNMRAGSLAQRIDDDQILSSSAIG